IRDLLGWSIGLNVGLAFIPGALASDLTHVPPEGPDWAAGVVWFDDLTINPARRARRPVERIAEHVLLPYAGSIPEADERLAPRLGADTLDGIIDAVPA